MDIEKFLNPSTIVGALLISIIAGLIVYYITKNQGLYKKNSIKMRDNSGFIYQDTKIGGRKNGKFQNKDER